MDLAKTLSGLRGAKVSKKGNLLTEGRYLLKVKNTIVIQPFNGAEAFIAELEVVESSDTAKHPVGSERTWYQSFKFDKTAFSELKKFTYAVLNLDLSNPVDRQRIETEIDPNIEGMMQAVITGNKFAGRPVRCDVVMRPGKDKNADKLYPVYSFSPAGVAPQLSLK